MAFLATPRVRGDVVIAMRGWGERRGEERQSTLIFTDRRMGWRKGFGNRRPPDKCQHYLGRSGIRKPARSFFMFRPNVFSPTI